MNNNVNNRAVNQNPAFQDMEFLMFRNFAAGHQEGVRVQLSGDRSRLIVADREAGALSRALKTDSSAEARAANNDVRTKLVKMVMRLCGVSNFNALDRTILAQFSGTKEHYTGLGSDMALGGTGEQTAATSGRPLSVRRITAILNATTEWLANNPVAPGPGQAQPRESMLKIETVVANLNGEDKEFSSLPTFDLETSIMIKGRFTVLLDRIKSLKGQTDQGVLWTLLHEFLQAVESEIASGDENKDAGLMMRFKREVFAQLEARNAELSEERKSLYSNDGFTELKLGLESFGAKWRPDNAALFEKLAPEGQDKAFLENCTTKQALEVNKLLTALKTLPAGFENSSGLRKHLLGRLQDALVWMQRNLAADAPITVGTWLQAFGLPAEGVGQKTLAQALLDAELTEVNITKFNALAPAANADFLKTCPSNQALAVNKLLTGLENLSNDIANGEELKSRLLGRLQDALAWMKHNLAADAPITVRTWLQAFGLPAEGVGQKTLVPALLDAELEKVRTENVDKFKALVPAGANADFLKESPGDQVLAINKLLTDLANLPNDIANGEELRSRLLGRLENAQTWMSNSGNRAANDLITVKTWLQAFGLPEGEGVEQKTLVQALLEGELANVRADNIALFKKLAPGVKNTAFLTNCEPRLALEVNKFLGVLGKLPPNEYCYKSKGLHVNYASVPVVRKELLADLEKALDWISKNQKGDPITLQTWWKAFEFDGNPPNEDISSEEFAKQMLRRQVVCDAKTDFKAFYKSNLSQGKVILTANEIDGLDDDLALDAQIIAFHIIGAKQNLFEDDPIDGAILQTFDNTAVTLMAALGNAIKRIVKNGIHGPFTQDIWWDAFSCKKAKRTVGDGDIPAFAAALYHHRGAQSVLKTEGAWCRQKTTQVLDQYLTKEESARIQKKITDGNILVVFPVLNGLDFPSLDNNNPEDQEIEANKSELVKRLIPKFMAIPELSGNMLYSQPRDTMNLVWEKLGFEGKAPRAKLWADFGAAVLRAEYKSMKKEDVK